MRVLVTGGGGFIGSNVVRLLQEESHTVSVLDNFTTGYRENLTGFTGVKLLVGDIRDQAAVQEAVVGVDAVVHMAASVGNVRSLQDPVLDSEVNVLGTLRVLEAARRAGIKKVVYSSSAALYGEPKYIPLTEDHPLSPDTPYGVSKMAGERHCLCYGDLYDMDVISLRYFNVYGPNQRYDAYGNVIPIFISRLLGQEPLIIYDDGEQTRDFVHVRDVATANLMALKAEGKKGAFNIGSGEVTTVNQLASIIKEVSNSEVPLCYRPPRQGDVRHSLSDISMARNALGYQPSMPLREGLKSYVEWVKSEEKQMGSWGSDG